MANAFARLLPFLEEYAPESEWLRQAGGMPLADSAGGRPTQGLDLPPDTRPRTVTPPGPVIPERPVAPVRQEEVNPFKGMPPPSQVEVPDTKLPPFTALTPDEYVLRHGMQHGYEAPEKHKGVWNRIKHALVGMGSGAIAVGQGGEPGSLERALGGALMGGIFGGARPESADQLYNQFLVEPEGERQYKKALIQRQVEFDKLKQGMELIQMKGALTGMNEDRLYKRIGAESGWMTDKAQRDLAQQNQYLNNVGAYNQALTVGPHLQHQQLQIQQAQKQLKAPLGMSTGYYIDAEGVGHTAPGFDIRFGQKRGAKGLSPSAAYSALERLDPLDKIVNDSFNGDPDAPYRIIARGPGGWDRAQQVEVTHSTLLGVKPRLGEFKPGIYSDDVVKQNEQLFQQAAAQAKAEMKDNAKKSRGLQIQYLLHPANDDDWDPNTGQLPYFPSDQEIMEFLKNNPYPTAPQGGGVTGTPAGSTRSKAPAPAAVPLNSLPGFIP